MDVDLDKLVGGVGPPEFELPKRDSPERIPGPELHRLTGIHAKVCASPSRRLSLPTKWVAFYSQFESTEWVTEELFSAMHVWAKTNKKYFGPGTFDMWLDEEYKNWVKRQEGKANMDKQQQAEIDARVKHLAEKEASIQAEKELVEEFHQIPDYEQKQYRDDTMEILAGRFSRLPPDWVVEVNAAKLWKRKQGVS